MVLPVHDWVGETNATIDRLPADVRDALFPEGGIDDRREVRGAGRFLAEVADAHGSDQHWHGDNKLIQAKPLPNLQGKWSDGEMVFRFREPAQAEALYGMALIWLLPGQVNLHLDAENNQWSVHVSPQVQRDQPRVVQQLMLAADDLLKV